MSSSIQASLTGRYADSSYGRSKLASEDLLFDYAQETDAEIYVYRFPNVFGKWCKPNYNSAVATFCHNIANNLPIQINDSKTELEPVYIDDLVDESILRNVYIWNRPVYVYRIGREGQSMGLVGVKKHYKEHGKVVRHVVQVRERMEEGPLKTAVEERLCLIIAEEFKFLCYLPMSRGRLREMGQLYRRCGRLCPDLLRKTEKRFNFVMLYARSHGLLYPFMRLLALLYAHHLLDPVLRLRDRMRDTARVSRCRERQPFAAEDDFANKDNLP